MHCPINCVWFCGTCSTYVSTYRITGNFCGVKFLRFGLKRRHLIFADFIFCGLTISAPKKNVFVLQEATTEAMLR